MIEGEGPRLALNRGGVGSGGGSDDRLLGLSMTGVWTTAAVAPRCRYRALDSATSNSTSSEESEDELEPTSGKLAMEGGGNRTLVSSIKKLVSGSELTEGERVNLRRNQLLNLLAILHKLRTKGGGAVPLKAEPDTFLSSLLIKDSLSNAVGIAT